jgi:hypothetical protein
VLTKSFFGEAEFMQAHRTICPLKGKQLSIDLPEDFPDQGEVEVIVLAMSAVVGSRADLDTEAWLQRIWGSVPDFPDRPEDLPPEPVAVI